MIAAYRRLAKAVPYPLHLGVTEAGTALSGSIRSAAGMSVLLYEGIGDTIRVSLSEAPVAEVKAAFDLLKWLGLRDRGLTLVACPPCGRAGMDLIPLGRVGEERRRALPVPWEAAPASPTATARRPASTRPLPPSPTSSPATVAVCASTRSSPRSSRRARGARPHRARSTARTCVRSRPRAPAPRNAHTTTRGSTAR